MSRGNNGALSSALVDTCDIKVHIIIITTIINDYRWMKIRIVVFNTFFLSFADVMILILRR